MPKRKAKLVPFTFRTVLGIKRWVRANVEPFDQQGRETGQPWSTEQLNAAVLWWHACEQAEGWGDLRTKDIANILLAGLRPLTLADLQETLDDAHESEDESLTAAQDIEANLRLHFGLKIKKPE